MDIRVLATGCVNCKNTIALINGTVVHAGGVPSRDKIEQWLKGKKTKRVCWRSQSAGGSVSVLNAERGTKSSIFPALSNATWQTTTLCSRMRWRAR